MATVAAAEEISVMSDGSGGESNSNSGGRGGDSRQR
jgi:hypothetical protein